jgi:MFS transporter, DHA1 family, tetracycline resistance protein
VGVVDIASQGYLTGKLLPKIGEVPLALIGLVITAVGMILVGAVVFVPSVTLLYVAVVIYTLGDGLFEPAMSGLISNATKPSMQGRIQGANQGTQSIARVVAPLMAAGVYQFGAYLPYFMSAVLMTVTLIILLTFRSSFKFASH